MAVTIYDIAKRVKTSAVTVSLALRDSHRVSDATKRKIKSVAEELGYRPNPLACGLVGAKTKTIAFVFNFPSEDMGHDISYMELFHVISQEASRQNYKLFVHSSTTAKPIDEVYYEVSRYGVDGIVLGTNINNDKDRKALDEAILPTVLLAREYSSEKVTCLIYGDTGGAVQAVDHLVGLGHTRIAFAGRNPIEACTRRYQGYVSALEKTGIEVDKSLVFDSHWDVESGERIGLRIAAMQNRPTAVLATTDLMAIGVISGLRQAGLSVPKDISVIGFDNLHLSRFSVPHLTTVDMDRAAIAKAAMGSLLEMIDDSSDILQQKLIPSKLIVRESTGICKS